MTIIVDTREQTPWSFPAFIRTERGTLKSGDYALKGDDAFAIERKSTNDFAGTISSGWCRFCREIQRMNKAEFAAKVVIVEGDYADFCFTDDGKPPQHHHPRLSPQFAMRRIAELTMMGVSVLFAGDAELAAGLALRIFYQREGKYAHQSKSQ